MLKELPVVRVAMNIITLPSYRLPRRIIYDYELLYIAKGELEVRIEGKSYHGRKGDFFLIRPGEEHEFSGISGATIPHIHFDLMSRDKNEIYTSFKPREEMSEEELRLISSDLLASSGLDIPSLIRPADPIPASDILLKIINEAERERPEHKLLESGFLIELLVHLYRASRIPQDPRVALNIERLRKAEEYIRENYRRDIALDELVKRVGMSKYYFIKLFRSAFNSTPISFQRRLRIQKAKEYLLFSDLSVTEISLKTGFSSIHSFSRAFREYVGISPSKFVRRHRGFR